MEDELKDTNNERNIHAWKKILVPPFKAPIY